MGRAESPVWPWLGSVECRGLSPTPSPCPEAAPAGLPSAAVGHPHPRAASYNAQAHPLEHPGAQQWPKGHEDRWNYWSVLIGVLIEHIYLLISFNQPTSP